MKDEKFVSLNEIEDIYLNGETFELFHTAIDPLNWGSGQLNWGSGHGK
jgi:hypothetical protein